MLVGGTGRVLQPRQLSPHASSSKQGVHFELGHEEVVGVLHREIQRFQFLAGEIAEVCRYDHVSLGLEGRRDDVAILLVHTSRDDGQHLLPVSNEGVRERRIHLGYAPFDLGTRHALGVRQDLVENAIAPNRPVDASRCDGEEAIAQTDRDEDTGVEAGRPDGDPPPTSPGWNRLVVVVDAGLLGVADDATERSFAFGIAQAPELEKIRESDPTVTPDPLIGNRTLVEQADE